MTVLMRITGLWVILFCSAVEVTAQQKKLFGFSRLDDTVAVDKSGFFVLPLLYYTPDTRWAYGGAGVYYFKIPPKYEYEKETRVSYIQFLAGISSRETRTIYIRVNCVTANFPIDIMELATTPAKPMKNCIPIV